jgi:hypothetical protein
MSSTRLAAIWEYAVEVIASALVFVLILVIFGFDAPAHWVYAHRSDLSIAMSVVAGIGGAILAAFVGILGTDFGAKLRISGEAKAYTAAFGFPILGFLIALVSLLFISQDQDGWALRIASLLLIYSLINCYTMIKNILGLVGVWQQIDRARRLGKSQ